MLSHPFFEGLDIQALVEKRIDPPYKPVLDTEAEHDLTFFDPRLTGQSEIQESVLDPQVMKGIKQNDAMFNNF